MKDTRPDPARDAMADPKIQSDWKAVLERLADVESRSGGDSRRRAILERVHWLKAAS